MPAPAHAIAWPSAGRRLLVLVGLSGFAISQPLLSVLGENPATIASHGVDGARLVLLALGIAFVPPLVLWLLLRVVEAINPRVGRATYLLAVAALGAAFAVQVAKAVGLSQAPVFAVVAMAVGVGLAAAHVRHPPVATWAAYTAGLPVLAAAMFVLVSPASALLSTPDAPEDAATGGDYPSVVLIVLDELPTRSLLDQAGGIDPVRFPNLEALAGDATWYRRHTALAPLTNSAVPALLTGQLPSTDPPLFASHPDNLFTLLAPTHELEVLESVTTLCPYESCVATRTDEDGDVEAIDVGGPGMGDLIGVAVDLWRDRISLGPGEPPALDDYAEEVGEAPAGALAEGETAPRDDPGFGEESITATSARAQALVDSFDAAKGPSLYYLHLMLPHQPWARYPDGEIYGVADPLAWTLSEEDQDNRFAWSDWIGAVSEQRHLLQMQYTDGLLGALMDGLRSEGLYDDSLVIVTADHGISFETGTSQRHVTASTIDAIAYAPLLIKLPSQDTGSVDDANVMSFDVVPSIAEVLGLSIGWDADGAPVGSAAIAGRGDRKRIDDLSGFGDLELDEVLEWNDADEFPRPQERWIGPLAAADDPLAGLNALLDAGGLLGARLDDLEPRNDERVAHVESLELVRRPLVDQPPFGLLTGRVPDAPEEAEVVVAINGVIVGGSKLSTDSEGRDGRFAVLLPQGTLGPDNDVRAALVVDGQVLELDVAI